MLNNLFNFKIFSKVYIYKTRIYDAILLFMTLWHLNIYDIWLTV